MERIIAEAENGWTVEQVAVRRLLLSRGALKRAKFGGMILLNGQRARSTARVQAGDVLRFVFPDKRIPPPAPSITPLSVVYEDECLLVIDKPAPLPFMQGLNRDGDTLQGMVYVHLGRPDHYVFRPVNRLDRGTSGLCVVAKDAHIQHLTQKDWPLALKTYEAITKGVPSAPAGTLRFPIAASEGVRRAVSPAGKPAITHYSVLEESNGLCRISLTLETGRTHQIRVHLSHIGCPIVGDFLYGKASPLLPGRFALHATRLTLIHPLHQSPLSFVSPTPDALTQLLQTPPQNIDPECKKPGRSCVL